MTLWGPDFKYDWPKDGDEWTDQAEFTGVPYGDWKRSLVDTFIAPYGVGDGAALDLGCGHGRFIEPLLAHFHNVLAVDWNPACVAFVKDRFASAGDRVTAVTTSGRAFPAPAGSIALVFSYDTLVHADEALLVCLLAECVRVLVPGGVAVIHHADAKGPEMPAARTGVSAARFAGLAVAAGFDLARQTDSWGPNGLCTCRKWGDVVTVLKKPLDARASLLSFAAFDALLRAAIHPGDTLIHTLGLADSIRHAWVKYRISALRQPSSIVETGVRAGYSGYALLLGATLRATYRGYDNDYDNNGPSFLAHAREILSTLAGSVSFVTVDTRAVAVLPPVDFYHVDADHSTEGARHELELCYAAAPPGAWILADDYDFIPSVRRAVDDFRAAHPDVQFFYTPSWRGEALLIPHKSA